MDNKTRIAGVVLLVAMAVLDSLAQQGILSAEVAELIRGVVIYALPAIGFGALVDVLNVERRRRDPTKPALKDDVTPTSTEKVR